MSITYGKQSKRNKTMSLLKLKIAEEKVKLYGQIMDSKTNEILKLKKEILRLRNRAGCLEPTNLNCQCPVACGGFND